MTSSTRAKSITMVSALIGLGAIILVSGSVHAAGPWYVAASGRDTDDCLSPSTPCSTVTGAISKASPGDTVYVATGVYTSTESEVVWVNKNITLSGGWTMAFAVQTGVSTIDGDGLRRAITVDSGVTATIERFFIRNGSSSLGGGVYNGGTLNINNCLIADNRAIGHSGNGRGAGIYNAGTIEIENSGISNNSAGSLGGGIFNRGGSMAVANTTISGNAAYKGGGLHIVGGSVYLSNCTITDNENLDGTTGAGIANYYPDAVIMQNSILAGNVQPDCAGQLTSAGYNILGTSIGCTYSGLSTGDLIGIDPQLDQLEGFPVYHPLRAGSPAINAGNPAGCTDGEGQPLVTDQRGSPRVGRCDVGASEASWTMSKDVGGELHLGGSANYTIRLSNVVGGDVVFNNVTVVDALPNTLAYVPGSLHATSGIASEAGRIITWTGSVSGPVSIIFSALISDTTAGQVITNTAIGQWSGVETEARVSFLSMYKAFLPLCMHIYSPGFFDDFSDPASGWPVGEDSYARTEYLNGEYRVLSKKAGYLYLFPAPAVDREDYTVEVDARWNGTTGNSYGVLFGTLGDLSYYYFFDMNTDYQMFRLYRRSPSGFTRLVAPTYSGAIDGGTALNHIRATRIDNSITLEVNGVVLGTWSDSAIYGLTGVGLVSGPYPDSPTSDARFDNFRVTNELDSAAMAKVPSRAKDRYPELDIVSLPLEMDRSLAPSSQSLGGFEAGLGGRWSAARDGRNLVLSREAARCK